MDPKRPAVPFCLGIQYYLLGDLTVVCPLQGAAVLKGLHFVPKTGLTAALQVNEVLLT